MAGQVALEEKRKALVALAAENARQRPTKAYGPGDHGRHGQVDPCCRRWPACMEPGQPNLAFRDPAERAASGN